MSTRPQRPSRPSPQTFRRRRIVALLFVIILLGGLATGVWALKNRLTAGPSEPQEPAVEEPTGPTEEELANPVECDVGALDLRVALAADSLPAGQPTNIPLTVANAGEVPCLIEMDKTTVLVEITSGDDAVWSSDHCGAGLAGERRLLLDVGAEDTTVVTWPGTRSAQGCTEDQPKTASGTYRLHVQVQVEGDTLEEEQVFGLH